MSSNAVEKIADAEQAAIRIKAEAEMQAKELIAAAVQAGREKMGQATSEAEAKAKAILSQAEEQAGARRLVVLDQARLDSEQLRTQAAGKLDTAAEHIIGKVVGG